MADINIRIGAKLDGLQRGIKKAQGSLKRFADFAEQVGGDLTTRLTLPVVGIGAAAVTSFAKFEKLELGLKALAEEGEDAGETLARLQKIAQLPGISLEQAVNGANQLRVVGFEAKQAEEILKGLSKAVTLDSKGPAELGAVVKQLTQMSAKGRILQEDLGVIQENVPSIGLAIEDAFGTQNIEAIRATGVSAQEFTAKIVQAIATNEKFQKAQGGLSNEFDNFRQSVEFSLASLGKSIAESINLSGILQFLSESLTNITDRFKSLSPEAQKFIVVTAGIAAAIGPIILAFGAVAKVGLAVQASFLLMTGGVKVFATSLLTLLANPIGATVAALAAVTIAIIKAYKSSETFRAVLAGIGAVIKKFAIDAVRFLRLPFDILGDLFEGNLEGAANRALNIFKQSGKTAGEAYADAYNASIQKSRLGEIAGRQTGSRGRLGGATQAEVNPQTTDLSQTFANLPSVKPVVETAGQAAEAIEEVEINFNRTSVAVAKLTDGLTRDLSTVSGIVQVNATNLEGYTSFIGDYLQQIGAATDRNSVLGDSFSLLSEKLQITRTALAQAVDQFGLQSVEVEELSERLATYREQMAQITTEQEKQAANAAIFADGITSIGSSIAEMVESGSASLKKFAQVALSAIADIIGALIKQGVAAAISGSLTSAPGPIGLALAAAAGGIASSLLKGAINKITAPKLAQGGIIPPGYEGDRFPAFLNSGEAVIPLDKLFKVLGNGGGGSGEFVLRGQDLILAMNRANYSDTRITGR